MNAIRIRAHAKINLNLRVLARRDDGFHDLRTVFQSLELHDTLTFTPRRGPFAIESDNSVLPTDRTNLIWKAAERLWASTGREGEVRDVMVRVEKRIPMKGGLGGGSSDAAATLVALARLWETSLSTEHLRGLGRELGADIGFFFTGGAALGVGRGDELTSLADLPRLAALLVVPHFDVSTADAYLWVDQQRSNLSLPAPPALPALKIPGCTWPQPDCDIVNDFEAVIAPRHPELDEVKRALVRAGASAVSMTGSGSTVFGLFEDDQDMHEAAEMLGRSGLAVLPTHTLSRSEYSRSAAPRCL